jgi:hypothetical protein
MYTGGMVTSRIHRRALELHTKGKTQSSLRLLIKCRIKPPTTEEDKRNV